MKQLFLSTLFLLVALSSWASGTATIDKSNRLSAYWYADRSMTAGSGKDEIHANHLQPGNEGTSSNKVFAINMLATFSSGVVKATTVSNGSLIDVLTIVFDTSLYAQGVKQKGQSGKAYTMTAEEDVVYATYNGTRQPVVRLMDLFNGESGRWAVFENNVFAKDLLNANPVYNSDNSTDAFYTLMTFVDRSNPTPMRIMGDTKFKVRYLRPIDVGLTRNKRYTFKDANEAGYDQLDLAPFVKFYDWRQYDFGYGIISNRSSWMSFYGINGAGVYAEEILCDLDGSINFLHKVAPKINVKVGEGTKPQPSYYYANDNQRYNAQFLYKMGSLRYQNNGVGVASFNLFVPIHIEHNWGEVIVMVQIPVIGTNSSNYSISWVSDEKLNEYLNYALTSGDNPTKKVIGTIGEPITSVSDLVNGGTYLMTSVGRHANDGKYLYESEDHYLLFESVAEGHDANAALIVEVIDGSHIYIKTQSGYYIPPYADPRGKFMLSNTEKEPLLIESIDGVEGQFTLAYTTYSGGSTAYPNASTIYLDADLANISNWGSRSGANGNGVFRFVPVTLVGPDDQTTGTITYIGSPITNVSEINANSYYLLTSVGRHGADGKYLYEKNLSVKTSELNFEVVNVGHDANAAFQFEPAGNNQFRIKTTSGNYVPIAQTTGWFTVSADNPGTFLIEPIEGVDDQFTLSCVGTAYYLDANYETASMWNTKSSANGNGAYRIVYCEIERPTAIDNVIGNSAVNTDQSVYTLQGQRVTNTRNLRPGIYIIGGKKVLIK